MKTVTAISILILLLAPPAMASVFDDGSKVRSVKVTYDGLPPERVKRLEATEGPRLIQEGVQQRLEASGRLDASRGLELVIHLDDFRMRSGLAAFFWSYGMAGGPDRLRVTARVLRDGEVVKEFSTDTHTVVGGFVFSSTKWRMRHLSKAIAERVVAGL